MYSFAYVWKSVLRNQYQKQQDIPNWGIDKTIKYENSEFICT